MSRDTPMSNNRTPTTAKTTGATMARTEDIANPGPRLRDYDPRHGTHAGYVAGCRCESCADGHYRESKERHYYRHRFGSCRVEHDQLAAVLEPWLRMGVTFSAICEAAGFGTRTDFPAVYRARTPVNRSTYKSLSAVTEDDLKGSATVPADLTRKRIYSLMAAGHALTDMPINIRGNWRKYERITIDSARAIRAHFQSLEGSVGSHAQTAARARNAGHEPPLAWDDPGTLAWPDGAPCLDDKAITHEGDAIDEVKVQRVLAGIRQDCTTAERIAVIEQWRGSTAELERITGWNVRRINREAVA